MNVSGSAWYVQVEASAGQRARTMEDGELDVEEGEVAVETHPQVHGSSLSKELRCSASCLHPS